MEMEFTSRQAVQIAGISQRQLAYWRKSGLVTPSHSTAGGHARYSFTDLVAIKTIKQLLDAGVSLQTIRKSIRSLLQYLPKLQKPLTELSLLATGDVILVLHEGSAFEALTGQEWIFPIAEIYRDIERFQNSHKEPEFRQGELFPIEDTFTVTREAASI